MRFFNTLSILAGLAAYASAAQSFAGSNLYYAAGLTQAQQTTLFTGLKDAGVKVLRVWLIVSRVLAIHGGPGRG